MNKYAGMTYGEAIDNGYRDGDVVYYMGYTSRKVLPHDQPVMIAGGHRKGQLYVELPNWDSTRYSYRQYLVPTNPLATLPSHKALVKEIAQELKESSSVEIEEGKPVYYLHIIVDEDLPKGYRFPEFKSQWVAETFTCVRNCKCETEDDLDRLYETETLHSPSFREVCEDLADQVLEYLEEITE